MSVPTDEELVEGLRRGEARAFDLAYERYRARLHGFLLRMCRRPHVAEELLQETWLRLASHAWRLSPQTRLAPWLFTVARNQALGWRRWALLDQARLAMLSLIPGSSPPTPAELAAGSEALRRLERALAGLPARYREVLLLVGVEGFAPAEVAPMLGLTPEATRQRLSRGRALLASALAEGEVAAERTREG